LPTLDEQVPQILRNARTIGIDLQAYIDQGLVRLQYDPPQEMEVDRHFQTIERQGLISRAPTRHAGPAIPEGEQPQ